MADNGSDNNGGLKVDLNSNGPSQHNRQGSADGTMGSPNANIRELTSGSSVDMDLKIPERIEDYEVFGTLFKKRGGWGKHLGWKARAFTLYQGRSISASRQVFDHHVS